MRERGDADRGCGNARWKVGDSVGAPGGGDGAPPRAEDQWPAPGRGPPGRWFPAGDGAHVFQCFASRGSVRSFEDGADNVRGPPGCVPRGGSPCAEGRGECGNEEVDGRTLAPARVMAVWLRGGRRARSANSMRPVCAPPGRGSAIRLAASGSFFRGSDPAGGRRAPVATGGTRTGSPADGSDRLTLSAGRRPVRRGVAEPVARADPVSRQAVAVRGAAVRSKRGPALAVRIGRVQDDPKAAEGTPRAPPGREALAARGDGACSLRAAAGWYTAWAPGTGTSRSARPVSDSVLPTKR